jgi:hypothetical protein
LELGLFKYLCLLIGIDLASSNQIIKAHVRILCENIVDLGCIGLFMQSLAKMGNRAQITHNLLVDIANAPE